MDSYECFYYPLLILERHLDTFGHVNNATYLQILEEARWDLITARGYGLKKIQESGQGPVIIECNITFRKELRLRQEVIIETQTLSYARKLAVIRHDIVDKDKKNYSHATITVGLFDMVRRKLIDPTPEWLHALGVTDKT